MAAFLTSLCKNPKTELSELHITVIESGVTAKGFTGIQDFYKRYENSLNCFNLSHDDDKFKGFPKPTFSEKREKVCFWDDMSDESCKHWSMR